MSNSSIWQEEFDEKLDGLMPVVGWIAGVICGFAGEIGLDVPPAALALKIGKLRSSGPPPIEVEGRFA